MKINCTNDTAIQAELDKAKRAGAVLNYIPAGPGKAYAKKSRYFITTLVTLIRFPSGWFMINCERFEQWSDAPEDFFLTVSPEQAEAIRSASMKGLVIA